MTQLVKEGLLGSLTQVRQPRCEPCLASRTIKKPFGKASRVFSSLELFHSDIFGPLNVVAHNGALSQKYRPYWNEGLRPFGPIVVTSTFLMCSKGIVRKKV